MDNRTRSWTDTALTAGLTGFCGGAHHANPQAEAETRRAQTETAKPAKSGCGCGCGPSPQDTAPGKIRK